MPYEGFKLSMCIVLPKNVDGLARLEQNLTHDRMTEWMKTLRSDRPVDTYLPKFNIRSEIMLSKILSSMGMPSAFAGDADFSRMSDGKDLALSEVMHQAVISIDESGTEASAATAAIAVESAPPEQSKPRDPIVFRADHPFLFVIRENRTGTILFMGRVQRP